MNSATRIFVINAVYQHNFQHLDESDESYELKRNRKNNEAAEHYRNGNYFLQSGKIQKACLQFEKAYKKSSDDNSLKMKYKESLKVAQAENFNLEGSQLLQEKRYFEAIDRLESAITRCPLKRKEPMKKFTDNLENAKNSWAEEVNEQAWINFNRNNFAGASRKFKQASKICGSQCSKKQLFIDNMKHAQAESKNLEGENLVFFKNYSRAISKFKSALKRCPSDRTSSINKYQNNILKSEAEIMNSKGDGLMNKQKFSEAFEFYRSAFELCPVDKPLSRSKFRKNMENAARLS